MQNYATKRSDQKIRFTPNWLKKIKKAFAFKASRVFKKRAKTVQNRLKLRDILRKTIGFSRSEMAYFRHFTKNTLRVVKKHIEA